MLPKDKHTPATSSWPRETTAALSIEPSLRYVALPELFTSAYSALESVYLYAEDAESGESTRFFTALASELGVYIAYGVAEGVAGSPARAVGFPVRSLSRRPR